VTSTADLPINKRKCLSSPPLPAEWPEDLLPEIARLVRSDPSKVVVLDDDPTGTQTVHGIPVLTHWSVEALAEELPKPYPACFILTNTRSLTAPDACRRSRNIGANLKQAAAQAGVAVEVISRSDSTLRGHFPAEVDAVAGAMQLKDLARLMLPCFFEGGRYTINDVHYVAEQDVLIPAAQTAYARDAVFGYQHSNLRQWVQEKTAGRIRQEQVASVSLDAIRRKGPDRVNEILSGLAPGSVCVVNAVSYRDVEVFVRGLMETRRQGKHFLYRSAASFVRVRCGIAPRDLLQADELVADHRNGGLFVVGSYVPKTTEQINLLKRQADLAAVEIDVARLLNAPLREVEVNSAADMMNTTIASGRDVLLYTSRELIKDRTAEGSLEIGRRVSDSLIDIVRRLRHQPSYLVAKGGITSSDIATKGLGVRRAMVMGQVLPGVPVWQLGAETRYPGMAYIVFPGNVGETDALAVIKARLGRIPRLRRFGQDP
jgi:uncharacterized protein YgbK (DUF1537 family)